MNRTMRHELFTDPGPDIRADAWHVPSMLYCQELDWTCALASVRSISGLEDLPPDAELAAGMGLSPGPVYSDALKASGILDRPGLDIIYGCDVPSVDVGYLWRLLSDGWNVMVDWMYSYDHWTVLLGYLAGDADPDFHEMVHWDPYCGETFRIRQGHFSSMWRSGSGARERDFVACRPARG